MGGEACTERGATSLATVLEEDPPFSFAYRVYGHCRRRRMVLPARGAVQHGWGYGPGAEVIQTYIPHPPRTWNPAAGCCLHGCLCSWGSDRTGSWQQGGCDRAGGSIAVRFNWRNNFTSAVPNVSTQLQKLATPPFLLLSHLAEI